MFYSSSATNRTSKKPERPGLNLEFSESENMSGQGKMAHGALPELLAFFPPILGFFPNFLPSGHTGGVYKLQPQPPQTASSVTT